MDGAAVKRRSSGTVCPGCLSSILTVPAFLQHATPLVVPRGLPQPHLVLLWPDHGKKSKAPKICAAGCVTEATAGFQAG